MKKFRIILKRTMIIFFGIVLLLTVSVFLILQHPIFGKAPSGECLAGIQQSPHYKNGRFENLSTTPGLSEGNSFNYCMMERIKSNFNEPQPDSANQTSQKFRR